MIYFLVFVLILLGGVISMVENRRTRGSLYSIYLWFAVPILLLIAGLRSATVDADYWLYSGWYSSMVQGAIDNPFLKDPSFAIIGFSLHDVGLGIASLIMVYCALCFGAQLLFAHKAFDRRWFALGVFLILCRFFIPHEMTQIRASVAVPLMSLAVLDFFARRHLRGSLLLLLAMSFHLSALAVLPICLILLFGGSFTSRKWVTALALLSIVGYFEFPKLALLLIVFDRTSDYVSGAYRTTTTQLFELSLLCRIAMVGFATLVLWKRLEARERLLIICSSVGMMLQIALASNDSLALRSAELFGLFDVASALMILSYLKRKTAVLYVVFLLCLGCQFYRSTTKIVQPYTSRLTN